MVDGAAWGALVEERDLDELENVAWPRPRWVSGWCQVGGCSGRSDWRGGWFAATASSRALQVQEVLGAEQFFQWLSSTLPCC